MSGKPWSIERKRAHGERMRARWRDPDYRANQSVRRRAAMTAAHRAEKSKLKRVLNRRMASDPSLKGANLAGIRRSFSSGERAIALSARMRETMAAPELRALAAAHCRSLAGSGHTVRGWKTRRLNEARRRAERALKRRPRP